MKWKHKKIYLPLLVLATVVMTIGAIPLTRLLLQPEFRLRLADWVEQAGPWGVVGLFCLQVLQVIVAFLPGEPMELAAGALYGTAGGLLLCLAGVVTGTTAIFLTVRRHGRERVLRSSIGPKLAKYDFLHNEQKLRTLIFLLYFIPGTPKDALVYVCALTRISLWEFLQLSTLARIPSVVSSTLAGASLASGNIPLMIGVFIVTGVIGLAGIALHNRLVEQKGRQNQPPQSADQNHPAS